MTKRNKIYEASDRKTAHVIKRHHFRIQVVQYMPLKCFFILCSKYMDI